MYWLGIILPCIGNRHELGSTNTQQHIVIVDDVNNCVNRIIWNGNSPISQVYKHTQRSIPIIFCTHSVWLFQWYCFNDIVSMISDSSDLGWYSFFWVDWNPMVAHGGHILICLLRKNVLKVTFSNIQFIQSTFSVNIPLLIGETYHFVVKHVVKLHQNTTKPVDFSSRKWPAQL